MAPRNTATRDRHRAIIARGKPDCALCHEPIDYTLTVLAGQHGNKCKGNCAGCVPHPMRYEVDHITPIAGGGSDELDNKQPSHRACNRAKWHHTDAENDGAPRRFVTWRNW